MENWKPNDNPTYKSEIEGTRTDGTTVPLEVLVSQVNVDDADLFVMVCRDLTEQKMMQVELAQAHKLESVGQLAAGIAHEINTPTQFVGDNSRFLKDSFSELDELFEVLDKVVSTVKDDSVKDELLKEFRSLYASLDIDYLREEIPLAIDQSMEGVERIGKIVRAMKEFSHPGTEEKTAIDLHKALEMTLTVAHNEWKYVADVELQVDPEMPEVMGLPSELNQVFLNLIVNAAHAIGETLDDGTNDKGLIQINVGRNGSFAEITIADNGAGIPDNIKERVYDPFFTTKGVGKGTGQGLAIARSVVVDKHQGQLHCESEVGAGTKFTVQLPLKEAYSIGAENEEAKSTICR